MQLLMELALALQEISVAAAWASIAHMHGWSYTLTWVIITVGHSHETRNGWSVQGTFGHLTDQRHELHA